MASPVRVYFRLAFALTWVIGGIGLLAGIWAPGSQLLSTSSPLYYLAAYSVSATGIALTAWYKGRGGLRDLGQRLIPWRSAAHWYLIVVTGYAAIAGIASWAAVLFGSMSSAVSCWPLFVHGLLPAIARDPGPVGEEFGWRGFALPLLLERYSPLKSSLILGLIHAIWHLPLFFIEGMPQKQLSFPIFTLGVISIAIFDTALYLRAGENLLLAILVHLMANVWGSAFGPYFPFFAAAQAGVASAIVIAGGLRLTEERSRIERDAAAVTGRG